MKVLYILYQLFIALPILLVLTILTAIVTIIGSWIGNPHFWGYYPGKIWSQLFCYVLLIPVKVVGHPEVLKKTSYVFVANHQGSFDIFLIYGFLGRNFKWMMKKSLRKMPFVGKACEAAGHIFVDKSGPKKVIETIEHARHVLQDGTSLVVFPEGARTFTGHMGYFKKGAFQLADDLESVEKTEENYRILSDVFSYLGYYTKAYHYLSEVANPQDMKDAKKLYHLKDRLECEGDRYASKRPRKAKDCSIKMPNFKYCSQPLEAGVFEKVDTPEVCDCCGKGTSVIYSGPFYSVEDINVLCPKCIASGKASKRFDGEFVDYAILSSTISEEYKKELCCRTPSYNGWQQEYWPDHCGDFCEFIAYVGWKEIVEMGLENSVEFTSESEGYSEHKEHIINGSSCQGYLFRCLNCKKYILYVDCD